MGRERHSGRRRGEPHLLRLDRYRRSLCREGGKEGEGALLRQLRRRNHVHLAFATWYISIGPQGQATHGAARNAKPFSCPSPTRHKLSGSRLGVQLGGEAFTAGYIAQWLERLTADQQVPGSNPGVPLCESMRETGGKERERERDGGMAETTRQRQRHIYRNIDKDRGGGSPDGFRRRPARSGGRVELCARCAW